MDNNWIDSLNQASGSILNAANVFAAATDGKKSRQFAERMYKQLREDNLSDLENARQYAQKMWNVQNEYDSPINQMQRMMQAGINPNNAAPAIAGVSASSPVANPTTPNTSSVPNPAFSNIGSNLAAAAQNAKELALLDAQINNINADTANKEANTEHTYVDAHKVGQEIIGIIYDNNVLKPQEFRQIESIIEKTFAEKKLTEQEEKEAKERTNSLIEQIKNIEQERAEIKERIRMLQAQEQTEETKQALNKAEEELNQSNKAYQDAINTYEGELQEFGSSTREVGSDIATRNATRAAIVANRKAKKMIEANKNKNKPSNRVVVEPVRSGVPEERKGLGRLIYDRYFDNKVSRAQRKRIRERKLKRDMK